MEGLSPLNLIHQSTLSPICCSGIRIPNALPTVDTKPRHTTRHALNRIEAASSQRPTKHRLALLPEPGSFAPFAFSATALDLPSTAF